MNLNNSRISLRPAADADMPFLLALYATTREGELAHVDWTVEQKAAFVQHQFEAQHRHWREHYTATSWDLVLMDDEPAGRLYVARWPAEIRVVDIALLPAFQGRGIGTRLFQHLFAEADAAGKPVTIHVEAYNPARRLYERLGFVERGEAGDVYVRMERPVKSGMLLGFAITRHCNLRCPHCIRDDVATFAELEPELLWRVVDEGRALWGDVRVSLTGGEPLIHRRFGDMVRGLAERGVAYTLVTNGWHVDRAAPLFAECPPAHVRLSLSGGSEAIHDAERGRGSWRRMLLATAILTRLRVPAAWSIVIDRRDRHEVRAVADLAESLGCTRLHYILPQPVPGSMDRDSDLAPSEWWPVAREIRALATEPHRRTVVQLDYGAPMEPGAEIGCDTFALKRVYVDVTGRLSTCCQLSEYGDNERDVVADLHTTPLADAWPRYTAALDAQQAAAAPTGDDDPLRHLPCMRCARATGKADWLSAYPASAWSRAVGDERRLPVLRVAAQR